MEDMLKIGGDKLSDIPQNVLEEIVRDAGNFAVAIFGITTRNGQSVKLCGSGTLVFASLGGHPKPAMYGHLKTGHMMAA